jgi:isoamylase
VQDSGAERAWTRLIQLIREGIKGWHGVILNQPDWTNQSHSVALSAELAREALLVHFIFNAYWQPLNFERPQLVTEKQGFWRRWIDTFHEAPDDIVAWQEALPVSDCTNRAGPRSVIVLWASLGDGSSTVDQDKLTADK